MSHLNRNLADAEPSIVILGGGSLAGTYVLRIRLGASLELVFGRFKGGRPISLPAGEYVYIGSALGKRGPVTLGRRLARHATRSGGKPPHRLRAALLEQLQAAEPGVDLLPRTGKRCFWNIDYLLDQDSAEITGVIAVRSDQRLEPALARMLEDDPVTSVIERGLGANDAPGHTHLLRVSAGAAWWGALRHKIAQLR